jgi:hypothetical protein
MLMSLKDLQDKLKDRRAAMVAEATGLHRNTVEGIRDGKNTNPTLKVLEALSKYFQENK